MSRKEMVVHYENHKEHITTIRRQNTLFTVQFVGKYTNQRYIRILTTRLLNG